MSTTASPWTRVLGCALIERVCEPVYYVQIMQVLPVSINQAIASSPIDAACGVSDVCDCRRRLRWGRELWCPASPLVGLTQQQHC